MLPKDVSALVDGIQANQTSLQLVNLNPVQTRKLIIQSGAFGEHSFTEVAEGQNKIAVNGSYFMVELPPASSIHLAIGMKRFVNKPSYSFPWDKNYSN